MSDDPNNKGGDPSGEDPRAKEHTSADRAGGGNSEGNLDDSDAGERLTSEEELDKMLAHAGGLAEELAADVGARPEDAGVMVTSEENGDDEQSVDAMLSELDDLVAAAADEIDTPADSAARADQPGRMDVEIPAPSDRAAEDPQAYGVAEDSPPQLDVPDFMREFTEPSDAGLADDAEPIGELPQPDAPGPPGSSDWGDMKPLPPPPINERSSASSFDEDADDDEDSGAGADAGGGGVPDFMLEFTEPTAQPEEPAPPLDAFPVDPPGVSAPRAAADHNAVDPALGVVGAPVVEDEDEAEADLEEAIHDVDAELQEKAQAGADEDAAAEPKGIAALRARIAPIAGLALTGVERALEVVDSPLSKRDPRVRVLAGFVALSTLGTAVVVYLLSMF